MPSSSLTLGIDLGGTTFATGGVDTTGRVLHSIEADTFQHQPAPQLLARLAEAASAELAVCRSQVAATSASAPEIAALGIGVPGHVKYREGVCVYAPNLNGWVDLPVAAPLSEKLGLPVFIINDAKAAALAEARFGAGRDAGSILLLTLGTGIGSGLVLDGRLHIGSSDRGAEVGHTTIEFEGAIDNGGNFGTVEGLCGRDGIVHRAMRLLAGGAASLLPAMCKGKLQDLTPLIIADAAAADDAVARQVWQETAAYLAAGIVNVILTVDVERVIIGGGIAQVGEPLLAPLCRAVAARTSRLHFDVEQIVPALLGPDAGLIGAATWAREQLDGGAGH
jgi:glucokinase